LRVIFMGTPSFAVPSLRLLSENHEVVAVFSRPDSVSGRGRSTRPTAVTSYAIDHGIPVLRPVTLRDAAVQDEVRSFAADVIVVAAYGLILPPEVLAAAPLGAINVHASLLPRWRGAAPIQRAILAGDQRIGVSIMRMEEGLDTGPYCMQVGMDADDHIAEELTEMLAEIGATALIESLPLIASGAAPWVVQDEAVVTYADKVTKSDVAVTPSLTAQTAVRRIRASSPAAPSRCKIAGRAVTLIRANVSSADVLAGSVRVTKSALLLGATDGSLEVSRLKPEGKSVMDAVSWARGARDVDESFWEELT